MSIPHLVNGHGESMECNCSYFWWLR